MSDINAVLEERIESIRKDILLNHLPRLQHGLQSGYPDENQALIVFDHLVRMRVLQEMKATPQPEQEVRGC